MKNFKKFLIATLAVIVLVLVAPVDGFEGIPWLEFGIKASAAEIVGEISSGETKEFSMDKCGVSLVEFTPIKSGEYRCEIKSSTVSSDLRLYDSNMNILNRGAGGYGSYRYALSMDFYCGETYYFVAAQTEDVNNNYSFTLEVTMENEIEDPVSIKDGETLTLPYNSDETRVVFIPEETGTYVFSAVEKKESNCKLYTPGMVMLEYDHGNSDCIFSVRYNLKAGNKYYYHVRNYDEIAVTMQKLVCEHLNAQSMPSVEASCDKTGFTEGLFCGDCERWLSGHDIISKTHTDANEDSICDICEKTAAKSVDSGKCGEEAYWSFYDNGELVISGKGAMYDYGKEDYWYGSVEPTPAYYEYIPKITKVTVEKGIRIIGRGAFEGFVNLVEAVLPDGLIIISGNAFADCNSLEKINLPEGLKYIGSSCFSYCVKLASLNIPGSVETYTGHMLNDCWSLREVIINEGTKEIGAYSFIGCKSLEEVNIPESVNYISESVFISCGGIKDINVSSKNEYYCADEYGVLYNKDKTTLLKYPGASDNESYVVPDSVKRIGDRAFSYSPNLKSVTLPEHTIEISSQLFEECSSLETFVMPADATSIGGHAFSECTSLSSVVFNRKLKSIGWGSFNDSEKLKNVVIPDSVISIESNAFHTNVESLTILNPDCSINSDAIGSYYGDTPENPTVIYGYAGSTAETYANENDYIFVSIDGFDISEVSIGKMPVKTKYGLNEPFSSEGFVLNVDYTNGKTYSFSDLVSFSNFDSSKEGICTVTASFGGQSITFDVEIVKDAQRQIFAGGSACYDVVAGQNIYLKFIPECNGKFRFYTWEDETCLLSIYDSDMKLIDSTDESCYYPELSFDLVQGKTYYLSAKYDTYSGKSTFYLNCSEIFCEHSNTLTVAAVAPDCTTVGYTEGVRCSDCKIWLSGHKQLRAKHTDENGDNVCDICSMQFAYNVKADKVIKISGDGEYYKYLKFVPERSGLYKLISLNGDAVELYDENFNRIYLMDGDENDDGYRTKISALLKEDTVYYILVNSYDKRYGLMGYFKAEVVTECAAVEMEPGKEYISSEDSYCALYEYTAEETETYKLTTCCEEQSHTVTVYDENLNIIEPDNRDYSDNKRITSIGLTEGKKYYFFTKLSYYYDETAAVSAVLTKVCSHKNHIDVPGTAPSCSESGWTDGVQCASCFEWISGHTVIPPVHTDDDADGLCDLCGALANDIAVDVPLTVCTEEYVHLKFIPARSGRYTLKAMADDDCDNFARLYDANDNSLKYNDDSGEGMNFSLTYALEKGKTYYFRVSCYDDGCTFDILLTLDEAFCDHENTVTKDAVEGNCTLDSFSAGEQCTACDAWVSGHEIVKYARHTDEDKDKVCDVCGEKASDIIFGQTRNLPYTEEENTVIRFIPDESGRYEFLITDLNEDSYRSKDYKFTDSDGTVLFEGYIDSDGSYVRHAELTAGEIYYFSFVDAGEEGLASILIRDFCPHTDKENCAKTEPTCEESGREAGVYCNDCENWITGGAWINATGHKYGNWTTDSNFTCTQNGSMSRSCNNCQRTEYQTLYAMHIDDDKNLLCDKCSAEISVLHEGKEGTTWWKLYNEGTLVVGGVGSAGSDDYDEEETDYAFYAYRDYVKTLRVLEGINEICYDFSNSYQLEKIVLADSVKTIWYDSFSGCTSLETVELGNGMEDICSRAFSNCVALKSIVIPASLYDWGNNAFSGCTSLETITVLSEKFDRSSGSPENDTELKSVKTINFAGKEKDYQVVYLKERYPDITFNCNYVPEHNHSFEIVAIKDGTCKDSGVVTYKCKCGISYLENVNSHHTDSNLDRVCDVCGNSTLIRSGDCSGSESTVTWSVYDNGDLVISGNGIMLRPYDDDYDVPVYYDPIVDNIIIEKGITELEDDVFRGFSKVKSVSLPDSLVTIGSSAFSGCKGLEKLEIPDSVTKISPYAFDGCSNISELRLSDNITSLDDCVFKDCTSLTEVVLPSKLEKIYINSSNTFENCKNLESFKISQDNKNFAVVDGVLYDKAIETVLTCPNAKTSVELPETVNALGVFCFKDTSIETVKLSDINKVSWGAFNGSDIKNIEIPSTATKIERWAFYGCDKLEAINVPGSVKTIDAHAFDGCSSAKTIELGEGIKSIFGCVFSNCTSVKRIVFPDSLVSLACDGDSYGTSLFTNCTNLEEIVLPVGIREFGVYWFSGCSALERIIIGDTVITDASYTGFPEKTMETKDGLKYINKTVVGASDEKTDDSFLVKDGTTSVAADISKAVIDTKGIAKEISLPGSVEYIAGNALGNDWLSQQSDGMIYIGNVAYKYKGTIPENEEFVIREGTKSISGYAFSNGYGGTVQANLKKVTIPEGVSIIGGWAFGACTNLSEVSLPDTLEYIQNGAFYGTAIESIVIPGSVERIYDAAFYGCANLKNVTVSDGVRMIGDYGMGWYSKSGVFGNCTSLESITLPKSVELIWAYAFNGCSNLETIEILNKNCEIYDSPYTIPQNTVIRGIKGSTAETYAKTYDREFVTVEIGEHTHDYKETSTTQPTCDADGVKLSVCEICGETSSQIIPATGKHTPDDGVVTKAATCNKSGIKTYSCTVCGNILSAEDIPVVSHTEEVIPAVEATCEKTGLTEGKKCKTCNTVTVKQKTVAAKGHKLTNLKAVAATCTKSGLTEGKKCTVCNTVTVKQKTVAVKGHKLTTLKAVAATCTKTGLTEGKKCTVCNTVTVKQKTVAAKGHKLTALKAVAATCTKAGLTEGKKCSVCNAVTVKQKAVAPKKHVSDNGTVTKKATYTSAGTKTYKCKTCKTVIKTETIKRLALVKVSGLKATPSEKSLKLTWKKVKGAEKYEVLYSTNGKTWKKVVSKKNSATVSKLKSGTAYKVKVRAVAGTNNGTYSTVLTTSTAPAKVTLSKVTAGSKSATPAWKTVSGASGYEVMYSTSKKFKSVKTATIKKGSSKKTTIKKLTKGKKYYFKVRAYKTVDGKNIYGDWSNVKSVKVK